MRDASSDLAEILTDGSFATRLIVDTFNSSGERTLTGLTVDRWEARWEIDSELKSVGGLRIIHIPDDGVGIRPRHEWDPLAPFGQEANLLVEVTNGVVTEAIQLGFFRLAAVPASEDSYLDWQDGQKVYASVVELILEDRLASVAERGFRVDENPASTSAWAEMARISGMQIVRSVADVTLPDTLTYQAVPKGRLRAVSQIARALGGTEYTNPEGALTVIPDAPGAVVGALQLGEFGTIVGDDGSIDPAEMRNVVVGDFETPERVPIHVEQEATGVLSPQLVGERTAYLRDSTVTTEDAAEAAVAAELSRLARLANRISIQCIFDPRIEIGDVLTVDREDGSTITGRAAKVAFTGAALMTVELDVIDDGL